MDAFSAHANLELGTLLAQLGISEEFASASGTRLRSRDGAEFLDMTASYGALPFGHNPEFATRAIQVFLERSTPNLLKGNPAWLEAEAAARLKSTFGAGRVIFTSGGAETVNVAVKAARSITGRRRIVAFWNSFHGTSGDALRVTGNPRFRDAFPESIEGAVTLCRFNDEEGLENALRPGDVAAVLFEPVQGEGGVVRGTQEFLSRMAALCKRDGALLVADEIQTGLGRCGHLSRSLSLGVEPDLLLLSKGLGAGLVPAGACLFRGVWDSRLGYHHSSTFGGYGLAMALVPLVLARLDEALLANVRARGAELLEGLGGLVREFPELLREARGDGLLLGLEFRSDVAPASRFLRELVRVFGILPAAVAQVRHSHRICLATTLNTHHTLRVTPALLVTSEECERTVQALREFLRVFRDGSTTRVVRWLVDKPISVDHARLKELHLEKARAARSGNGTAHGEPSVAFLVHPNSEAYLHNFDPAFRALDPAELERLARNLSGVIEPVHWHQFEVRGLKVHVIASPFLPSQITSLGRRVWTDEVELMVLRARSLGARLVGLGGLLSVVTRDGQAVPDHGVGVTTGNSLTAFAAYEALVELAERHHRGRPRVAMLGGYGNIGLALSELALRDGFDVVLFGNPDNPLRKQMLGRARQSLEQRPGVRGRVILGDDLREHTREPIVAVTATSNPAFRLDLSLFQAGSTVLDLAMPPNLAPEDAAAHPELQVYRIGRVRTPVELPGLHLLELADTIYGCLAETIVLGLERDWKGFSRGPLEADAVLAIGRRARALGFVSAYDPVLVGPASERPGTRQVRTGERAAGAGEVKV
ncbi:MAG: aminotransferase class III-fold pyridoxal phosphate-dependent enzyme [Candidatus Wallbacteria bacterium]|nr:aminotransferase class III-fold pyridoxal phosphate-dependent enzyme [Candidatus Wallbacteria bacterium]